MTLTRICLRLWEAWESEDLIVTRKNMRYCDERGEALMDALDICRGLMSPEEFEAFQAYES